jgi:GxxExxY protein
MIGLIEEEITRSIIGAFYTVYNTLGFGFLEHIYVMALERELLAREHQVAREVSVQVIYKGEVLSNQRIDMIVDGRVIVEAKAGAELPQYARHQLCNYLKATNFEVGLLLHFGANARIYREVRSNQRKFRSIAVHPPDRSSPLQS